MEYEYNCFVVFVVAGVFTPFFGVSCVTPHSYVKYSNYVDAFTGVVKAPIGAFGFYRSRSCVPVREAF